MLMIPLCMSSMPLWQSRQPALLDWATPAPAPHIRFAWGARPCERVESDCPPEADEEPLEAICPAARAGQFEPARQMIEYTPATIKIAINFKAVLRPMVISVPLRVPHERSQRR